MAATLEKIYQIVTEKGGYDARMSLAQKTGIPRTKAIEMDDSPEVISRFKAAADEILGTDIDKFL
ncbi:MAG: hypothetical protein RB296_06335 [Acidobacteriota bacterium]|jgi:hypothetical protein|nr:hypothetical protein [Acidobacteriota bacterium]